VTLPITDIVIGTRHRKHLGDMDGLADSIKSVGLLHPPVILPNRLLIAGERRIRAALLLGWTDIPVRILDLDEVLDAETAENVKRLNLAPSEAVMLARALRERIAERAKARQEASRAKPGQQIGGAESAPPIEGKGKTRDAVAEQVGMGRSKLEQAETVVAAKEADPELAAIAVKMDSTGNVSGALRAVKRHKNKKAVAAAPVVTDHVPGQKYRCIVIDPPWDRSDEGDADQIGRAQPTYATMPLTDIEALPVGEDAEDGCHIYLWITNRSLPKGFALLRAWGFRYITQVTWCKPGLGIGNYFRNNTEHMLFGVRSSLPLVAQDIGTWFAAGRGPDGHSSKPSESYDLIRRASPGPRAEWFGRRERDGFVQRLPAVEL
jgi:N6-adenosine-specific RNA methylase IME4